jgi:2-methylcitrate dehydratase PrpD
LNFDAISTSAGHIGIVCLAAPLAAAEAIGRVSGRRFLAAACAAAEVAARLKAAMVPAGQSFGPQYLSGQMLGYFGCAAGAGNVLGLSSQDMHSAFGLSLMQASGSMQLLFDGDPPAKAIYGGFPNQAGVLAAWLSNAGLDAACRAIDGEAGLFALINAGLYDRDTLLDDLGIEFQFTEAQCKPWPTSVEAHPFIEAAIKLHRREFDLAAIGEVTIIGPPRVKPWLEPADVRCRPPNAAVAANSIPFAVANALCRGDLTLPVFTPEGLADQNALSVAGKVRYLLDESIRGGIVEVTTTDGATHRASVPIALGHPTRPMPYEDVVAKFRQCCRYAAFRLTDNRIENLIELIEDLEQVEDMRQLARAASAS